MKNEAGVVVDDPLPAGFEAVDSHLATSSSASAVGGSAEEPGAESFDSVERDELAAIVGRKTDDVFARVAGIKLNAMACVFEDRASIPTGKTVVYLPSVDGSRLAEICLCRRRDEFDR